MKRNKNGCNFLLTVSAFAAAIVFLAPRVQAAAGEPPSVSTTSAAPAVSTSTVATAKPLPRTAEDIVFPPPPDKPRIRFVRSIRSVYDLKGRRPGFWAKFFAFFGGGDVHMPIAQSPFGISVRGDLVYLTDITGQKVVRLDLAKNKVFEILGLGTPTGVTSDPAGNVYVSDSKSNAVLAFDCEGKLLWKADVLGKVTGVFKRPTGIVWTPQGELLINDTGNGRMVVLSKDGKFLRALLRNKDREVGALPTPTALWMDPDGGFMVTDPLMARVHIFSSSGSFVSGFGEQGDSAGYLARPRGLASDSDGNVYVADALFHRVQIFDRKGELELYFGGPGIAWGMFLMPAGIFIDKNDRVYIADSGNSRLEIYQYIKDAPEAAVSPAAVSTATATVPAISTPTTGTAQPKP